MNNNNDKNFDDMISFIENSNKVNKVRRKKTNRFALFLINILSISLLVSGGVGLKMLYDKNKDYEKTKDMEEELEVIYNDAIENDTTPENELVEAPTTRNEVLSKSFSELLNINSDTVGWLTVNNTNINMPIVQASNNEYYLTHNFKKEYSSIGWLFADYRNEFGNEMSQNTIIYGHTFRNGSNLMMSTLRNVLNSDWLSNSNNFTIEFNTPLRNMKWKIFSIYTTPVTNDYLRANFVDSDDFLKFANNLKSKSIKNFGIDIKSDDNMLTLSTCYKNSDNRLVVHAILAK